MKCQMNSGRLPSYSTDNPKPCYEEATWEVRKDWASGNLDTHFYCGKHTKANVGNTPATACLISMEPIDPLLRLER